VVVVVVTVVMMIMTLSVIGSQSHDAIGAQRRPSTVASFEELLVLL
jgi:hypothetical protein